MYIHVTYSIALLFHEMLMLTNLNNRVHISKFGDVLIMSLGMRVLVTGHHGN
jgi:hypothetical protein